MELISVLHGQHSHTVLLWAIKSTVATMAEKYKQTRHLCTISSQHNLLTYLYNA